MRIPALHPATLKTPKCKWYKPAYLYQRFLIECTSPPPSVLPSYPRLWHRVAWPVAWSRFIQRHIPARQPLRESLQSMSLSEV